MGNNTSNINIKKVNFEDIQEFIVASPPIKNMYLINTLPAAEQDCLIPHTVPAEKEEALINQLSTLGVATRATIKLILYGKNTNDPRLQAQYIKLQPHGFTLYVYYGGMFEWLLLQDIYGAEHFPTTQTELDLLKFKPISTMKSMDYM